MSNMKAKDRKSLCEESMLVLVNILKLSSLSLARRSLVTKSGDHHYHETPPLVPVALPRRSKAKRSQKPEQPPEAKVSYVMIPDNKPKSATNSSYIKKDELATVDGHCSAYIRRFHEKTKSDLQNATVEGMAEDYIKRFHEKNMNDLNNESMRRSHYVLPPPPRQVFK